MSNECRGCDQYENQLCKKWGKPGKCDVPTKEWFDDTFDFVSLSRVCRASSLFGNFYLGITQKDIDRLKNGEVLHLGGEYGFFIHYIGEKPRGDFHSVPHYRCPACGNAVKLFEDSPAVSRCEYCGQMLNWPKEEA